MNTDFSAERLAFILKEQKQAARIKELEQFHAWREGKIADLESAALLDKYELEQRGARIKELESAARNCQLLRDFNEDLDETACAKRLHK